MGPQRVEVVEVEAQNLRISVKYTVEDWNRLDGAEPFDWEKGVEIFRDRMEGRYLDVLDRLQKMRNSGFILLAMDCALIETLQQFRLALPSSQGVSTKVFTSALLRPPFDDLFDKETADRFFDAFRCGLLHQAQTGPLTRIRQHGPAVELVEGELCVNRDEFHGRVRQAYKAYAEAVLDPSEEELRTNFRKKMRMVANNRAGIGLTRTRRKRH